MDANHNPRVIVLDRADVPKARRNGNQPEAAAVSESNTREFVRLISLNPTLCAILDRLPDLSLPDAWIAGGCLFQTAWNVMSGHHPSRAIKDYDIFYFDPQDCTRDAEERANQRAATLFADLGCMVDARNQARVHLWYAQEFGTGGY